LGFIILCLSSNSALSESPVEVTVLENGLKLITKEDHSKNLIALCGYVKGGSRIEPRDKSGISHYLEHLVFRGGSQKQKPLECRKKFQELGQFFGYTSSDATCYYFIVPKENFDSALERYVDALMSLNFDQERLDRERTVVLEEIKQGEDSPETMVDHLLQTTVFTQHPYGQPVIGFRDVIMKMNLETISQWYRKHYTPNHIVLAVVGDFEKEKVANKIKKAFPPYQRGEESFDSRIEEPTQNEFRKTKKEMKVDRTYLLLGFPIPKIEDSLIPALDLLALVIGQGKSSHLYRILKEKQELVFEVDCYFDSRKDYGLFTIEAQLERPKLDHVIGVIFNELKQLAGEPLSAQELDKWKTKLSSTYLFDHESYFRQAELLCYLEAIDAFSLESSYLDRVKSLSGEDLQRIASKYLTENNATLALVEPEETHPQRVINEEK